VIFGINRRRYQCKGKPTTKCQCLLDFWQQRSWFLRFWQL